MGCDSTKSSHSRATSVVRQKDKRTAAEVGILQDAFDTAGQIVLDAMADLFGARPCRMSARDYTKGLLASFDPKNRVTIAECAGRSSPDRLRYLLERVTGEERELRVRLGALDRPVLPCRPGWVLWVV